MAMKLPDEDRNLPGKPKPPKLPRIPVAPGPGPSPTPGPGPKPDPKPGKDPYAEERKKAEERARKTANKKARTDATTDLTRLNSELKATRAKRNVNNNAMDALHQLVSGGVGSHDSVRNTALASIDRSLTSKLSAITSTFTNAMDDFNADLRSNEKAEADASFANLSNRARERGDLMTQALSMGAGESDVLRTQQQALRNWSANQADVNRSFFDTRNSVNAAISDLNTSTKTGLINEEMSANAARAKTYDEYFESMANTFNDLASYDSNNFLLELEGMGIKEQKGLTKEVLAWLKKGKNIEDFEPSDRLGLKNNNPKFISAYAQMAADMTGSTWDDPGISASTEGWQGGAQSEGGLNSARSSALGGGGNSKRPEGATLRRW